MKPGDIDHPDRVRSAVVERRIKRQVLLTGGAIMWERIWPALWPVLAIVGGFVAVSLFDLWRHLPGWLHVLGLLAVAGGLGAAIWRARSAFVVPDLDSCINRLERLSGVPHRPLTTIMDAPAGDNAGSAGRRLWRAHQRRMIRAVQRLRVVWPRAGLARHDPYGLRVVVVLALVIGIAVAGRDAPLRLADAFSPDFAVAKPLGDGTLVAWITPPDYTGLPPVYLTGRSDQLPSDDQVVVAENSVLIGRVHGGRSAPVLRRALPPDATEDTEFGQVDQANYEIEFTIADETDLSVVQDDKDLGRWRIETIPDRAPEADLPITPQQTRKGVMRLEYTANDDYGLAAASLTIHRADEPDGEALILELPLAAFGPTEVAEASYHDLTHHIWAGMPVELFVTAQDQAGQSGQSRVVSMILPARAFNHPVAKAIVEQRRVLALAPDRHEQVRSALGRLSEKPEDYDDDLVVHLGLRSAYERLDLVLDDATRQSVIDLLWDVALHIEEGSLSLAERDLRAAEEALRDALNRNASNEEIRELTEQLEAALREFLDQLEQQADSMPFEPSEEAAESAERMRDRSDIEQMLEETRDLAMTGSREAAQDMLMRLQEMLENLQAGQRAAQSQENELTPMMRQLEELMEGQQQLLDETFEELTQRSPGNREQEEDGERGDGATGAERQEQLRRELGELMRQLGEQGEEIPAPLGNAEREMKAAGDELQRGRPDRALDPQGQALDQLRQGATQLQQRLAQRDGTQPGPNNQPRPPEELRDPLGRLPPGMNGDSTGFVEIPEQSDIQRSREILDELYRRAGERQRGETEREYIERLLRWY